MPRIHVTLHTCMHAILYTRVISKALVLFYYQCGLYTPTNTSPYLRNVVSPHCTPSKSIYKSCIRFRFRIICIFHFLWIFLPSFFRSKQLMHGYAIVSGLLCSPYGFKNLSVGYGLPWLFRSKRLIILSIFWRELQLRVC